MTVAIPENDEQMLESVTWPVAEDRSDVDDSFADEQIVRSGGFLGLTRSEIRVGGVIMAALAVIETLLFFKLALLLGELSPENGFLNLVNDVSKPLAEPSGIFVVLALLLVAIAYAVTFGPLGPRKKVASSGIQSPDDEETS